MYWKTLALGLVLACALGTQARALSFSAGNLIVTTDEQIFELASLSGEIVDELQLAGAVQPCFLPNGNLLVVGGPGLLEIAPGGEIVRQIDFGISDEILGVVLGPGGEVYVRIEFRLLRVDLETGDVEGSIELAGQQRPCFLPNGNLLVPLTTPPTNTAPGFTGLLEVDPGSGAILRVVEFEEISPITGATPGPDGLLILTTEQEIVLVDLVSGEIVDELQLAGAVQPCFLPNGNLLVIDGASGALQVIDLETGGVVQIPLSGGATGFTFVPYRFEVLVRGTLADGDEIRNLFFAPFELALSPGTRQIILISDADSRLAAAFETETLVLFGFEAPDSGRRRLFQGSQVPSLESGLPLASLVLRVEGRPAELFAPVSASGSLHVAGGERILLGNVSASMLLNR